MVEEFPGVEIAVIIVTASIMLAAILLGLGKAFGYKRLESFGVEELIQSVINAAIIGSFAAIMALISEISASLVTATCQEGDVILQLMCTLTNLNDGLFSLYQELVRVLNLLGYYQSLSLDFGAFAISPFTNLSAISGVLSAQLLSINLVMILIGLNIQIAQFIGANALSLLFPVGLVLRTFFATRKVGGFLIALAIGLYLFYPTFVLIFPIPADDMNQSVETLSNFTNNSYYAAVPVIDLNDNYAIAGRIDLISGRCFESQPNTSSCNETLVLYGLENETNHTVDFSGDLTMISGSNTGIISKSLLYAVVAPLFSLIVTIIFVKELASLLGSEIGLKTIASI